MGLKSALDFSENIRTHATVAGVIFALTAIGSLLYALVLYLDEDKLPEEKKNTTLQVFLLVAGIISSFVATLYWIGFLKRVRWCLTVVIVLLAVAITLHVIDLFGAIVQLSLSRVCVGLFALAITIYETRVTDQLRTANSEIPESQEESSAEVS